MRRAAWMLGMTGTVLLAAGLFGMAGCSLFEVKVGLTPEAKEAAEYYAAQTVDEVALRAEMALQQLGLTATTTSQGNGLVLDSMTRKGSKFRIFITAEADQRTRLRVEWIDVRDRDVQMLIIGGMQLALAPAKK